MRAIELFTGAGGLAKGLELAGFEHAAFVEFNKHACQSLRKNHSSKFVYEGDVSLFDFKTVGDVDLVAGGPPCQPFSLGGKHKANDDLRDMFPHAIRAIEDLQPKAFIFENVKGLLRKSFESYFSYIIKRLEFPEQTIHPDENWEDHLERLQQIQVKDDVGTRYIVHHKLLNAADYGVPQKRERVFIVGIRADLDIDWSYPEQTHSEESLLWSQNVTGEYWTKHHLRQRSEPEIASNLTRKFGFFPPTLKPWRTIRDCLKHLPDPTKGNHGINDHIFKDGARSYAGHTGSYIDLPSKTIKAGAHGVPGGENMIRFEDDSVRYLTVHEAKLLQTFPSDYQIEGAWGEAMRQIGNAVPVAMAKIIGEHLFTKLNSLKKEKDKYQGTSERSSPFDFKISAK